MLDDVCVRADSSGLTQLPPGVLLKHRLRELLLSRNLLTAIPPAIAGLASLRVLRMGRNLLTSVPPEIGQLTALATLDLSGNRVRSLSHPWRAPQLQPFCPCRATWPHVEPPLGCMSRSMCHAHAPLRPW
jgi:Leucine-rich repeat (LRR) protein